jgi:protein-disulfide isomerase
LRRARALVTAACLAGLVSACASSDQNSLAGATGAMPAATASNAKTGETFNPFGESGGSAAGGRQVIANPTPADIFAPSQLPEMALGKANAPLTIVQYASMTCPHCRHFHKTTFPQLKKEFIDTGKVRYILREFPIGKQSGQATIALRCAPPDKYFTLYGKLMESQETWVSQEVRLDPIFAVAKQVGVTRAAFDACLADEKLVANLNAIKEHGRKLGIIGTPNYFVGTSLVKKELTIEDIRAAVANAGGAPAALAAKP